MFRHSESLATTDMYQYRDMPATIVDGGIVVAPAKSCAV